MNLYVVAKMATQTCDRTITGNNFDYGSALTLLQEEDYLEEEDFDEIRLIRRRSKIIQAVDDFDEKMSNGDLFSSTQQKRETQNLETGLCYGYSNSGYKVLGEINKMYCNHFLNISQI